MILTISPGGSGFHFLCWSICFLRGDNSYKTLDNVELPMIWDPLDGKVAHKFAADHIKHAHMYQKLFSATDQSVIYFVPNHQRDFEFIDQFHCKKILFDCRRYNKEFFARMHNTVPECGYSSLIKSLSKQYDINIIKQVLLESNHFFTKYYHVPEDNHQYFLIDYEHMFQTLDTIIIDVFKYLELDLNEDRFAHWQNVYKNYKALNHNHLEEFLSSSVTVASSVKMKIIKEIIDWKNGSFQTT